MDRPQPHSPEHEEGIIACCLLSDDTEYLDAAVEAGLKPSDFHVNLNADIFSSFLSLSEDGKGIDELSLLEDLKKTRSIEISDIYDIQNRHDNVVPTPEKVKTLANVVIEKSKLRQLIRSSRIAIEEAMNDGDVGEVTSRLEAEITRMNEDQMSEFDISVTVDEVMEGINGDKPVFILPWHIDSYDKSLRSGGMRPKQIHVLAARPGKGKTTLALNIAGRASSHGHGVGIFSLEMGAAELVEKVIGCVAGVDLQRVEQGVATAEEQAKLEIAAKDVKQRPMYICDDTSVTPSKMKAIARQWKRKHDIKLIILDYLQLMSGDRAKDNRESQVSEISRNLKCIAKELELPIIVLAQLNRKCEDEGRKPKLSDLRESGAIEQDADTVTFLYNMPRDESDYDFPVDGIRWCRAKQRAGQSYAEGLFKFQKSLGRIIDFKKIKLAYAQDVGRKKNT